MHGFYDPRLVTLSVLVAIIASFTALDLAGCVSSSTSSPRKSWTWLIAGAFSLGIGIWSMHFIGMLAFHLPVPLAYGLPVSLLSMAIAVLVSALALCIMRRPQLSTVNLVLGATVMGIGIAGMHYTGMFAMRMSPPIHYMPVLVAGSVLIAMGASLAALWIGFQLRRRRTTLAQLAKLGSACIMGVAIAGMHYTGMAAAQFAPDSVSMTAMQDGIDESILAILIGGSTVAILTLTLIVSALDAHFALNNVRLAEALRNMTLDLHETQSELVAAARQAGMAQIANNVLHNVGNVLNSVNVSAGLVSSKMRNSKLQGLTKAVELMNANAADLGVFFTRDERGKALPGYLNKLDVLLGLERQNIVEELICLIRNIDHIKEIVATQQTYAGATTLTESVQVQDLLEDALRMNASGITGHGITIVRAFVDLPLLQLDRHLVLQILVNLIGNAKNAMQGVPDRAHQITVRTQVISTCEPARLQICVEDDGEGIAAENLPRLFAHGFTTRKSGHGFGLHSCALAAKDMGATISARSDGPGRGAAFVLEIPMKVAAA